jgi:hypothetical protein
MATAYPPARQPAAQRPPLAVRLQRFWSRVTEGLEVSQLWSQFETRFFHLRSRSCTLVSKVRDGARSLSSAISDNALSIPA